MTDIDCKGIVTEYEVMQHIKWGHVVDVKITHGVLAGQEVRITLVGRSIIIRHGDKVEFSLSLRKTNASTFLKPYGYRVIRE